jgi:multiple sugar transport system substrate-binding protein
MKNKKKISISLLIAFLVTPILFSGCLKEKSNVNYKMPLEVWGVFDDTEDFGMINNEFARANPQITEVRYKKISANVVEYEKELFDAIAGGKGPDVIFFNNTWLPKHQNKLAPLPDSEKYLSFYKENFIDVASADFVKESQIYAMPLWSDTLALYYNKDLFNQNGITAPPKTWKEVEDITKRMTKIDRFGNINQSAIALGRSSEPGGINRASDILMLMMMQNGTEMFDERTGMAIFERAQSSRMALDFYTKFAMGSSDYYTWNSNMDYSIDSFRFGKTAMMVNYAYLVERLRKLDPKFNFDVAPVPQTDLNNQVNLANYWGLSVVKNKELVPIREDYKINYTNQDRINESWYYIQYMTTNVNKGTELDATKIYLEQNKKPAARRDLIEEQKNDVDLGVFAEQILTAESWPQPDNLAVEEIFVEMINDVVSGKTTVYEALKTGASRVNNLIKR